MHFILGQYSFFIINANSNSNSTALIIQSLSLAYKYVRITCCVMYKSNYFKCAVNIKFYWAITSNGRQWFGNGTIHLLFNEPMPKKMILQIHSFYYILVQFTCVVYVDIGDVAFTSENYEISVANFFILPLKKISRFHLFIKRLHHPCQYLRPRGLPVN